MLARSKKAFIYLILALAIWGGLAPRLTPCMPQAVMACCVHEVEQCAMEEDCCRCGSAPAGDLTIPTIIKPPRAIELPVGATYQASHVFDTRQIAANSQAGLSTDNLKPPRLYLLKRSLLI